MLRIHCTHKLAKAARIDLQPTEGKNSFWLEDWYANLVPLGRGSGLIAFMNAQSLYAILVPCVCKKTPFQDQLAEFKNRLLTQIGNPVYGDRLQQHIFCKTRSRSLVGSLTEINSSIQHFIRNELEVYGQVHIAKLEEHLNTTPCKAIKFAFPSEVFADLLQTRH